MKKTVIKKKAEEIEEWNAIKILFLIVFPWILGIIFILISYGIFSGIYTNGNI